MRTRLAALVLLTCATTAPIGAEAAALSTESLKAMLVDLGYEPSVESNVVTLENQGASKADLKFQLIDDNATLSVYASWSVPKDKESALPATDMLKANSNAPFAFAVYMTDDKSESVDLEASYDVSMVGKKMLRRTIDTLLEQIDEKKALWDADLWKTPASSGSGAPVAGAARTIADARSEYEALWTKAPMTVEHAMFVMQKVASYGGFEQRGADFRRGDEFHIYVEPKNFAWKQAGDDVYNIGLRVGVKIRDDKDGSVDEIVRDQDIISLNSHDKVNDMMLNLSVSGLEKIPVGSYSFICKVSDKNSDKSVEFSLPFKIVAP